jgi:hypothetical protein
MEQKESLLQTERIARPIDSTGNNAPIVEIPVSQGVNVEESTGLDRFEFLFEKADKVLDLVKRKQSNEFLLYFLQSGKDLRDLLVNLTSIQNQEDISRENSKKSAKKADELRKNVFNRYIREMNAYISKVRDFYASCYYDMFDNKKIKTFKDILKNQKNIRKVNEIYKFFMKYYDEIYNDDIGNFDIEKKQGKSLKVDIIEKDNRKIHNSSDQIRHKWYSDNELAQYFRIRKKGNSFNPEESKSDDAASQTDKLVEENTESINVNYLNSLQDLEGLIIMHNAQTFDPKLLLENYKTYLMDLERQSVINRNLDDFKKEIQKEYIEFLKHLKSI